MAEIPRPIRLTGRLLVDFAEIIKFIEKANFEFFTPKDIPGPYEIQEKSPIQYGNIRHAEKWSARQKFPD